MQCLQRFYFLYAFSSMSVVFDFENPFRTQNLIADLCSSLIFTRLALKTDVVYMSGVRNQHDIMNVMPKVRVFSTSHLVTLS